MKEKLPQKVPDQAQVAEQALPMAVISKSEKCAENERLLILCNADPSAGLPRLIWDEASGENFILLPWAEFRRTNHTLKFLNDKGVRQLMEENFSMRLEKAVLQSLPLDFEDVMAVAQEEIARRESLGQARYEIDIDLLMNELKKSHANLFIDLAGLNQRMARDRL